MKALLLLSLLLSSGLYVSAAAVGAVEAAPQQLQEENQMVPNEAEAVEAAPEQLQEENQMVENEAEAFVPEETEAEMVAAEERAAAAEGHFFLCPSGWHRHKSSCYLFVAHGKSWSNAAAHCAGLGASLASAHDEFDYSFLQQLSASRGQSVSWLGGFYFQGWRWVDQSSFSYTNWYNQYSTSSYQCIHLYTTLGWSNNYKCTSSLTSICMRSADGC